MLDYSLLADRLNAASGGDAQLDRLVAETFGQPPAAYSESVEAARALLAILLSGWHVHVGYGVSGVLPYVALSSAGRHVEAEGPSVPLAMLRALLKALPD